jgi:hypothetical protein
MKKKASKPRIYVELTAVWGNGDASSIIKVSRCSWQQIQNGAEYDTSVSSWYEGRRDSVNWHFADGEVSVDGEDGSQCVVGLTVAELINPLTQAD